MKNAGCIDLKKESIASMKKLFLLNIILVLLCLGCRNPKEQIKLLSYKKDKCYDSSVLTDTTFLKSCMQWQLDSLSIIEILNSSEPTDFIEVDVRCLTLPCEYNGEVIIHGEHYEYRINAGGYTTLWRNNTTFFLIYRKENKFFLEKLWAPE